MVITRHSDQRLTQFDIFNATPEPWSGVETLGDRGIRARRYLLDWPRGDTPSLRDVLPIAAIGDQDSGEDILADWISVFSRDALHVASLGPEPVAAIGPPANARVSVDFSTPVAQPDDRTLHVRADYQPDQRKPGRTPAASDDTPMVDVLGPEILVWTRADTRPASFSKVAHQRPTFDYEKDFSRRILSGYSSKRLTRGAETPALPDAELVTWQILHIRRGTFAARIVAGAAAANGQPREEDAPIATPGTLEVAVPRVLSRAKRLVKVFRKAQRDPIVQIPDIPFITPLSVARRVDPDDPKAKTLRRWFPIPDIFQLPPAPPTTGLNVFGALRNLRLAEARGSLTLGATRTLRLQAPTPLELQDIVGRGVLGNRLLIPVELDARSARVRVQGRATASLNGEPIEEEQAWIVDALSSDRLTLIGTLAAALLAGGAWRSVRRNGAAAG